MDRDAGDEALKDEAGVRVVAIRIDLCGVHEIVVDLHGSQIWRRGGGSGLDDGDLVFQIRDLFADTLKDGRRQHTGGQVAHEGVDLRLQAGDLTPGVRNAALLLRATIGEVCVEGCLQLLADRGREQCADILAGSAIELIGPNTADAATVIVADICDILLAVLARGMAVHGAATGCAEGEAGTEILMMVFGTAADVLPCGEHGNDLLLVVFSEDGGMVVVDDFDLIAGALVVDACVDRAFEHCGDITAGKRAASAADDPHGFHLLEDRNIRRRAVKRSLRELAEVVCLNLLDQVAAVAIGDVPERIGTARVFASAQLDLAALDDLRGEVEGVILRHALHERLEDHGLRAVAKVLRDGDELCTAFADQALVDLRMVAVAGEAIPFMDEDEIDGAGFEVIQQPEKVGALVGARRLGAIDVPLDDLDAMGSCVLVDLRLLRLDRGFVLAVGGISGIIDGGLQADTSSKASALTVFMWICG